MSKDEPQEIGVGELLAPSLSDDERVQRWNDKQALIIGSQRDDHVGWRCSTDANTGPTRALPFEVEFLFNVDLAGARRLPVQPKRQAIGWIRV